MHVYYFLDKVSMENGSVLCRTLFDFTFVCAFIPVFHYFHSSVFNLLKLILWPHILSRPRRYILNFIS